MNDPYIRLEDVRNVCADRSSLDLALQAIRAGQPVTVENKQYPWPNSKAIETNAAGDLSHQSVMDLFQSGVIRLGRDYLTDRDEFLQANNFSIVMLDANAKFFDPLTRVCDARADDHVKAQITAQNYSGRSST